MNPLVTIIIPIYNSEQYLAETIESAINQTWQNKEVLLIDDGSTDGSLSVAKRYENAWIKVFHQENKGASAARNYGLREAKGDYIQFLDADDLLSENKIESQIDLLKKHEDFLAICPCVHFFGQDGEFKQFNAFHDQMNYFEPSLQFIVKLYGGFSEIPASMIELHTWLSPSSVIKKAGYWNEDLTVDDDGEYFLRVVLASNGILNIKTASTYYRKRKTQTSLSAQLHTRNGFNSSIKALNLKLAQLNALLPKEQINQIFAKFYWEKAFLAYPAYYKEYTYCYNMSLNLEYKGLKFIGSKKHEALSNIIGWKSIRSLQYSKHLMQRCFKR